MKKTQEPLIFHSGKNYGPESASRDITDKILLSNFFSQRQLDHRNVETSKTTMQKDKPLMAVFKANLSKLVKELDIPLLENLSLVLAELELR